MHCPVPHLLKCKVCRAAKKPPKNAWKKGLNISYHSARLSPSVHKQLQFLQGIYHTQTLDTREIPESRYGYCSDTQTLARPITRPLSHSSSDCNDRCTALPVHANIP